MGSYRWFPSRARNGVEELQTLVNDLENLLESGRDLSTDQLPAFKARLRDLVDDSRETSDRLIQRSRRAIRASGEYVGEHPWQTAALLAAAAGLLAAACAFSRQQR
ncbi:YqjD family protein [Enterobacterales bacterium AE_CKDN230030158-1A_HGKHYDSX7]